MHVRRTVKGRRAIREGEADLSARRVETWRETDILGSGVGILGSGFWVPVACASSPSSGSVLGAVRQLCTVLWSHGGRVAFYAE